ncbi:MAG: DUF4132 domain-containing protein [Pseudomonadota bacterium]|nr:DUF4132 domain-containing protein [Pseudomonadota bacterium]
MSHQTANPVPVDALDWPKGGFRLSTTRYSLRLPVVRGVHCPPYVRELHQTPQFHQVPGDTWQQLAAHFRKRGRYWSFWTDAEAHAALSPDYLQQADLAAWQEALAHGLCLWRSEWFMQIGIAQHGLVFMLKVVAPFLDAAHEDTALDVSRELQSACTILRHAIADSSEAEHAEALEAATRLRAHAAEPAHAFVYLFPHHAPWVAEALAGADPASQALSTWDSAQWLPECAMSVNQARAYWQRVPTHFVNEPHHSAGLCLLLLQHGGAALPVLDDLLSRSSGSYQCATVLNLVECMSCPEQLPLLVRHADSDRDVLAVLDRLAPSHPDATLWCAIDQALSVPHGPLMRWTQRFALYHPQALARALAALPVEQAEAWAAHQPTDDGNVPQADIPLLLRDPPWLHKTLSAAPKVPTLQLRLPAMSPKPDRRETSTTRTVPDDPWPWLRQRLENQVAEHGSLAHVALARLNIRREHAQALLDGEPMPKSALGTGYHHDSDPRLLAYLPPSVALEVWNHTPGNWWSKWGELDAVARRMLAQHGAAALPGLAQVCRGYPDIGFRLAHNIDSAHIACAALRVLRLQKKTQDLVRRWILAHLRTSILVALTFAFSKDKAERSDGAHGLYLLMRLGHEDAIDAAAAELGTTHGGNVPAALAALKAANPLHAVPAKLPRLGLFFNPIALPRLRLRDGRMLPASASEHLGMLLALGKPGAPHLGLEEIKTQCDLVALEGFAWALFEAWQADSASLTDGAWVFHGLGELGGDDTVRRLMPLIRSWRAAESRPRAAAVLEALGTIGTDLALMHLNAIAGDARYKGLQDRARDKIAYIAQVRELTPEELADRTVPDLGLDDDDALTLDFGPRQFTVAFDETLKPFVKDADGVRLKSFPKATQNDDATLAQAAGKQWRKLQKDAKAIAATQINRLEQAMVHGRRWSEPAFHAAFIKHPLMRHLAARLIWATYDASGHFVQAFRVAEDLTLADENDEHWYLPADAQVGIAHVLDLPAEVQTAFGQRLADYEILQPFRQISRETDAFTKAELAANRITRFAQRPVAATSLMGLLHKGWRHGVPHEGHWVEVFVKPIQLADGDRLCALAVLDGGMSLGDLAHQEPLRIARVTLHEDTGTDVFGPAVPLNRLSPIAASELLRDLDRMATIKK